MTCLAMAAQYPLRSTKYCDRASLHGGKAHPRVFVNFEQSSTLKRGRRARAPYSAVVMGISFAFSLPRRMISQAKSNHEHWPELVPWYSPYLSVLIRSTMALA